MRLPFLDRADETSRLSAVLDAPGAGGLAVVYGRRRCGKSTLLRQVRREGDAYYLADEREALPQIQSLAQEVARVIPGFAAAHYPSWDALLRTLNERATPGSALILDEFPWLAQVSPELPSLLQKYLDSTGTRRFHVVLCGSSQRMMHGLVLDATAPLYGRAEAILRVDALAPGWMPEAFPGLSPRKCIEAYAVWGGVPRYWELAGSGKGLAPAIRELILNRNGTLHEEPMRLLLDDMRTAAQPYSVLSLIGEGCHRLSEIGARLGKPAVSLSRPLALLVDLGYVARDVPFGENMKSTKRTLYRLRDPFFGFYFRFVQPRQSMLELGMVDAVAQDIEERLHEHVAGVWEWLARWSVPFSGIGGREWGPASRWWGQAKGQQLEVDVVAESRDGRDLLIGEAKWAPRADVGRELARLRELGRALPFVRGRRIVPVLWCTTPPPHPPDGIIVQGPADVLRALR